MTTTDVVHSGEYLRIQETDVYGVEQDENHNELSLRKAIRLSQTSVSRLI